MVIIQNDAAVTPSLMRSDANIKQFPFLVDRIIDRRISNHHWHDYMQIWYTVSGEYYHTINGIRQKQTAGSIALVFPFTVHSIDSSKSDLSNTRVICVSVYDSSILESAAPYSPLTFSYASFDKLLLHPMLEFSGKEKDLADEFMESIYSEYNRRLDMNIRKITNKILSVLDLCARNTYSVLQSQQVNKMQNQYAIITEATKAIHSMSLSDTSIDSMCKYLYLSRRQFTDKFKETTGHTYGWYTKMIKLNKAVEFLRYSQKSLVEIAECCGFTTRSYFINEVKSVYSVSPLALKQQMIEFDKTYGEHLHNLNMEKYEWRMSLTEADKYEYRMFALGIV